MQIANSIQQSRVWEGHKSTHKHCTPLACSINSTEQLYNLMCKLLRLNSQWKLFMNNWRRFFQSNFKKTVSTRINVDVTLCIIYDSDWGSWCKSSFKFTKRNENTLRVWIAFSMLCINIKKNLFRVESFARAINDSDAFATKAVKSLFISSP